MAVEYSKVATTWPSTFKVRFGDVHDDGYSIFVIVFDESMKGIDCVALYCSVGLLDEFNALYDGILNLSFLIVLFHLTN